MFCEWDSDVVLPHVLEVCELSVEATPTYQVVAQT